MSAPRVQSAQPAHSSPVDGPAPRKRRKRAPAAGASDDCFTCSNRSLKCDRRRPYCSQCLDDGKECSGYKTQLTWGVGVASRGKLRGLSLPVAGTKKVAGHTSPQRPRKRQSTGISQPPHDAKTTIPTTSIPSPASSRSNASVPPELPNTSPALPSPFPPPTWDTPNQQPTGTSVFQNGVKSETVDHSNPYSLPDASMPPSHSQKEEFPPLSNPVQFSNHDRLSSMPYSVTNSGSAFFSRPSQPPPLYVQRSQHHYPPYPPFAPSFDPAFSDPGSFAVLPQQDESYVRNETFERPIDVYQHSASGEVFQPPQAPRFETTEEVDEDVEEVNRQDLDNECAILDDTSVYSAPLSLDFSLPLTPFSSAAGIGKTPRMQFLINYYAEVISPVIVAFDGPNNPYRTQILRLAQSSETLQHAISALAASNLRQRRETGVLSTGKTDPARRSSMAHLTLTEEAWHDAGLLSPQDQAREETFHKNYAVQSLNQQLADPILRKKDSILAVLLILCLFHICDSGVAKFQTQFAGVKKLLSLRGNDLRLNTPETKWFTRMFTWFDAMTASVNDREGQLQGHHLDVSAFSDEEWSLENLAGCDGQLFKTIAKLGRLNVLSQGKSVESNPTIVCRPPPLPFAQLADYSNFDGNGWMRIVADEDLFSAKVAEPESTATQFWREWREIRQTLQTWQLDPSILDTTNPDAPLLSPDQRMDLVNISESFRYSALLYTERLANPTAASTDANIQAWVRQSLNFIQQVKSDVYLLWPLFITGSECVEELDRAVIRERCLDIQRDSGFLNNKSCLDLIEKIWAANPLGEAREGIDGFRFRRVMEEEGSEGEYIVV